MPENKGHRPASPPRPQTQNPSQPAQIDPGKIEEEEEEESGDRREEEEESPAVREPSQPGKP